MAKILIADDEPDLAESLANVFALRGHEAKYVLNGRDAVAAVRSFAPAIVILDLEMPVLDGFGAAAAIKGDPQTYHVYVIALSGASGPDVEERVKRAGFDSRLVKPADVEALLALITRLVSDQRGSNGLQ